jgi:hypothetical protein
MNRVGMPDYMLFFRKDGENPDRIEHAAPGDIDDALPIAKKWLEHMRRDGLCGEVPDDDVIRELLPHVEFDVYEWQKLASPVWMSVRQSNVLKSAKDEQDERHLCVLQLDVIENCLRLYSKPGDVVMDPFNGVGSTGTAAIKGMRRYVGFELKDSYAEQASRYLIAAEKTQGDLFS